MADSTNSIFYILILVMSIVIHEVSHGFMAEYFGDDTARKARRLTLNPIPHIDIFGSIFLPAILILTNAGFLFGWAKPVPYNPNNLSHRKLGTIAVAAAGVSAWSASASCPPPALVAAWPTKKAISRMTRNMRNGWTW